MQNYINYTDFTLRRPPKNVKVMMVFTDDYKDVCYIDDWGIFHGEQTKIIKGKVPKCWKKIERNSFGEYDW